MAVSVAERNNNGVILDMYGGLLKKASSLNIKNCTGEGFRPSPGAVLVKPVPRETMTDGGLYIPEQAQQPPQVGVVVSAGDNSCPYQQGQVVLFRWGTGTEVTLSDGDFMLLQYRGAIDDDILGCFPMLDIEDGEA